MTWVYLFLDVPEPLWKSALEFWPAATCATASAARGEDHQFVTLLPPTGDPWVKLQAIGEPTGRVHVDIDSADRAAAVAGSLTEGAVPVWNYRDVAVMRSPGGLLFCHTLADPQRRPRLDRGDIDTVLDQVCIDIPSRMWDTEVTFWQNLSGRQLEQGLRPEFAFLGDQGDAAGSPRILLQRLDDETPAVTAHPDFAVSDRPAQVRRHQGLGATRVADFPKWTVMRAPTGHVYCLTDRDPMTGSVHRSATGRPRRPRSRRAAPGR